MNISLHQRHALPVLGLRSKFRGLHLTALIQKRVNPRATPAQFSLPEPPPRPHAKGIPPLTEEEAQEKRKRYLETIGAVLKNLENRMEAKGRD